MGNKRTVKNITNQNDLDYILSLTYNDMQKTSVIMELFGIFNSKRKFNPYDIIEVPIGSFGSKKKNKNKFTTTIGLWIFNKFFLEQDGLDTVTGYINKPITNKEYNKLNSKLSYALLEDKIELKSLKNFIDKTQKYQPLSAILAPNHTSVMLLIEPKINVRKKQLLKKYDKEIKDNNALIASEIEKELLDYARELLKDDPSMDMYNSGALGIFENNFKNMFIMKGAVLNPNDPAKGYNIITSNYMEGISREEYSKFANGLAAGPYARAKKTASGGYMEKLFLYAFQDVILDEPNSDCGTKRYIEVFMDDNMIESLMYSYIVDGSSLVELTSDNMDKYRNKFVKVRFASMCEGEEHICNKCAGNMFYRLGIRNVGVATPQYASRLKVSFLKLFHDTVITYSEMDINKAFGV